MSPQQTDNNAEADIAADLVRRAAGGDHGAEGEIVSHYGNGVRLLLTHLCRDPDLAADLFQDTFRIVIERIRDRGIDEPRKLAAFIRQTARNLLIADNRLRGRRQTYSDSERVEASVDATAGPFEAVAAEENAGIVRDVINTLPTPRDRQLLMRFYIADEDKTSICRDLGLDSLHFNRVIHRARRRFREMLEARTSSD